jgi:hypothetical protein
MNEKLKAVFDEHASPKHAGKHQTFGQLAPIVRLVADVRKQLLEYRTLLTEAALEPENDAALNPLNEMMHQTIGHIDTEATAFEKAGRELMKGLEQLDRYMANWKGALAAQEAAKAQPPTKPTMETTT